MGTSGVRRSQAAVKPAADSRVHPASLTKVAIADTTRTSVAATLLGVHTGIPYDPRVGVPVGQGWSHDAGNFSVQRFLGSDGRALPAATQHHFQQRLGADLSRVRLHDDSDSAQSATRIGAAAYTLGQHIVLGPSADLASAKGHRLLAHELAHTVQQGASDLVAAMSTHSYDSTEREAGAAARGGTPVLSRAPLHIAADTQAEQEREAAEASTSETVITAMSVVSPVAGVGDFPAAYAILDPLSVAQLVQVANRLEERSLLGLLLANVGSARGPNRDRVFAVLRLVRLARTPASQIPQPEITEAIANLQNLNGADRDEALQAMASIRGVSMPSPAVIEGLAAMLETAAATASTIPEAAQGAITGPIGPGPWAPPGGQPIPFYIGNEAHISIGATYVAAHPGNIVYTNFFPMSTIVPYFHLLEGTPNMVSNLTPVEQGLKPDIADWQRRHLYEIKPANSEALAATEARMYRNLFARAGLAIWLGPTGEPGTAGALPAPDGVFLFSSPQAGVITYRYRKAQVVPVPVEEPETAPSRRWTLRPLTRQQQQVVAAAATGLTAAVILMYILEYGWILAL